jgi:hypothetical protein
MLYCGSRRDDPHVLQPVETKEFPAAIATILNHEVMRFVSDLGPDIKQICAFLLPSCEGVGRKRRG